MGRAKLRMELLTKEKTRNTTYQKRKLGIVKKANEFAILCDVDTVIIIYPPNSNVPEIWPEDPEKIKKTIASYKSKKTEGGKRNYDLNDFFEDRKKKIEDELVKARKRNMEAKYSTWFDELNGLPEGQLRHFAIGLENKENLVRAHLEFKKRNMQVPFRFEFDSRYLGSHPGFDQGQTLVNHHLMSHELGLFGGASVGSSFVPLKQELAGYGYPVFEGSVVYDGSNPWGLVQAPMVHCGPMAEFGFPEVEGNNDGGEFMVENNRGRFMG